jgi:hypothetical protein
MDMLYDDVIYEILKHYKYVRCINKDYYNRMLVNHGNSRITMNEITTYNKIFCIYKLRNYNFSAHVFIPMNNCCRVNTYSIMYAPQCISPDYYNNNVKLLHYTETTYNNHMLKTVLNNNNTYDSITNDEILSKRFNHIKKPLDIEFKMTCDFDIMFKKLCYIMYLLRENVEKLNNLLDQKFQFRNGKLIDRYDDFTNYINLLDNIIKSY